MRRVDGGEFRYYFLMRGMKKTISPFTFGYTLKKERKERHRHGLRRGGGRPSLLPAREKKKKKGKAIIFVVYERGEERKIALLFRLLYHFCLRVKEKKVDDWREIYHLYLLRRGGK